jgi:ADP-dependent phosphofructokinase/glucokinase
VLAPEGIVLGLGGTVDYEVRWDGAVIDRLAQDWGIQSSELIDLPEITSERDLLISLIGFVHKGIGGERSVVDPDIIHSLASRLSYQVTLGGTPVRAALVMAVRGILATVHLVSTNDETRTLLPRGTRSISSATGDTLFPHLIVQYPQGATLELGDNTVKATRANRLIYTHDPPNEELLLAPELGDALSRARLFLISGLNIFKDETLLRERLAQLEHHCANLTARTTVVYEDAGFHIPRFSQIVRDALLPFVDVYSMNEDEAQEYLGHSVDLGSGSDVQVMLESLHERIPAPHLMVHTHLWAALVGPEASKYASSLRAAVQMASARYHFGDSLTLAQYDSVPTFAHNAVAGSVEDVLSSHYAAHGAFSPGFQLDTEIPTTIGLGDSFIGGFLAQRALEMDEETL